MNLDKACKLFNILPKDIDKDVIKKKYHKLCLQYHPDKNKQSYPFHEINEAYELLKKYSENKNKENLPFILYFIFHFLIQYFQLNKKYKLEINISNLLKKDMFYFKEKNIFIPLWHKKIKIENYEFIIIRNTYDYIRIDKENNIFIKFKKNETTINIDNFSFRLNANKKIKILSNGIPKINEKNIYSIKELSNIHLYRD